MEHSIARGRQLKKGATSAEGPVAIRTILVSAFLGSITGDDISWQNKVVMREEMATTVPIISGNDVVEFTGYMAIESTSLQKCHTLTLSV